jgi:tetratricopeptide (TPR) repeat protein
MAGDDYRFDLGSWTRRITTSSEAAQVWFDRGLTWTFAYNHEEAVSCFRRALGHDPSCAMAWWGIAYASGPFYNRAWIRFSDAELAETLPVCHEAAVSAAANADGATPPERALIDAVRLRYQSPAETDREVLDRWHREFTDAMRAAHHAHPGDLDITALFAEAAVTCTPRQLFDLRTGEPKAGSLTVEALAALEPAVEACRRAGIVHPGVFHMLIHALEMSPYPERGLFAADSLRGLAPDAGHLEHMPAHVYVLCGQYAEAVEQSRRAVAADDKYLAFGGETNFYTTARCHDLHLYVYSAMLLGQYGTAMGAAERLREIATPELIAASAPFMASILDGYSGMASHVRVRFGRWRELTREAPPADPALAPIRAAMHHYARGVAHAALGEIREAEAARDAFVAAREAFTADLVFLSNTVRDTLAIGVAMMDGEIAYRRGAFEEAFTALRLAVERHDALNYTEPWAWAHPLRHALGALLAEQGCWVEAEAVYRADLGLDPTVPRPCRHPDNVWALHGLVECVMRRGGADEAAMLRQRLTLAQARTDVPITSACACRGQRTGVPLTA